MASKPSKETAQQTFRQFAWNLAGALAAAKSGAHRATPAKPGGKR